MAATMYGPRAETWDRSLRLTSWSRVLVAQSQRLVRPVFRGGSDSDSDGDVLRFTDLTGIRVMVVDDDKDNVEVMDTFLRICGATVLTARSGAEALSYLNVRPRIDVLLTDLTMPALDGIELVRRIRAHPTHGAVPAVAVSGYPESRFGKDAECFSAFLLKPVDLDTLAATVKRVVPVRQRRQLA
jgi:CheY-like chemotaxis protein